MRDASKNPLLARLLRQCQTDIRAREEYRQPSRAHALYAPPPDPTGPYPSRGVRGYPKRARIVLPRSSVGLGSGRRLGLGKYTSDAEHVALLRALYRAPLMRGWSTQLGRRPPARKLGRIALFQWHSADSPPLRAIWGYHLRRGGVVSDLNSPGGQFELSRPIFLVSTLKVEYRNHLLGSVRFHKGPNLLDLGQFETFWAGFGP